MKLENAQFKRGKMMLPQTPNIKKLDLGKKKNVVDLNNSLP